MFEDHLTTLNTVGAYYASGEGYIYEFAVNLETLNYLQTINLLDDKKLEATLEYMQTSIALISCFTDLVSMNPFLAFVTFCLCGRDFVYVSKQSDTHVFVTNFRVNKQRCRRVVPTCMRPSVQ